MSDEYTDTFASKTQHKRDADAVQQLGEKLMQLKPVDRSRLPLPPSLMDALQEANRIKSQEARRRHAQYIGKLMRQAEHEQIRNALEKLHDPQRKQRLSQWAHSMEMVGDDRAEQQRLVKQLLGWFSHTDRQHLRNLVRNLHKKAALDPDDNASKEAVKQARRKLLRYLNELDQSASLGFDD